MHQTIKTRSGRIIVLPTDEEDLQIRQGIALDSDTRELTDSDVPFMRTASEQVTIRLSSDIAEVFRSTGSDWQSRIDAALRQYLQEHPI